MYTYRDARILVTWLTLLFSCTILLSVVSLWSNWLEYQLLQRADSGVGISEDEATFNDARQGLIGLAQLGCYVLTIVFFCIWVNRANKNARALGAQGMQFTPGWAVGYFFIPIMNLFRPYQVVAEIMRASDPRYNQADWDESPAALSGWWWGSWLINNAVGQAAFRLSLRANAIKEMLLASSFSMASDAMDIPASLLALAVVRTIHKRQCAKANAQSGAPPIGNFAQAPAPGPTPWQYPS